MKKVAKRPEKALVPVAPPKPPPEPEETPGERWRYRIERRIPKRLLLCAKCGRDIKELHSQLVASRKLDGYNNVVIDVEHSAIALTAFCHDQQADMLIGLVQAMDFMDAGKPMTLFGPDGLPCDQTQPPPVCSSESSSPLTPPPSRPSTKAPPLKETPIIDI